MEETTVSAQQASPTQPELALAIPIEVSGFNAAGRFFTCHATTQQLTRTGCRFQLAFDVDRNSLLAIRSMARGTGFRNSETPVLFQIASIEKESDGWVLSVTAAQPKGPGRLDSSDAPGAARAAS